MGFETTSTISSNIVLHDNESFRPQKLNIKLKNETYFHMQKEFLGYIVSAWRNSNFREKRLPKLTFRKGRYFPVILSFSIFFIFRKQSQVFTATGQKCDIYMTTSKKLDI